MVLLSHPSIHAGFLDVLEIVTLPSQTRDTLLLFARGSYRVWLASPSSYLPLPPPALEKLRRLSLCAFDRDATYDEMEEAAGVGGRELEELIAGCVHAGLLRGKMDQAARRFRGCASDFGRDAGPEDVLGMVERLERFRGAIAGARERIARDGALRARGREGEEEMWRQADRAVQDARKRDDAGMEVEYAEGKNKRSRGGMEDALCRLGVSS